MKISLFDHALDNEPEPQDIGWDELAASMRDPRRTECTLENCRLAECVYKNGDAWSPAAYPIGKTRAKTHVAEVALLVLDHDGLTPEAFETQRKRLAPYQHFIVSSHSDRAYDRRVRSVIALSRPVAGVEWTRFWTAAVKYLDALCDSDTKCRDASRLYYSPSRPSDADFHFEIAHGEPLDVEVVLASAPVAAPILFAQPQRRPHIGEAIEVSLDRTVAAAHKLGDVWPRARELGGTGNRHEAGLALCGALSYAGWQPVRIAEFVTAVADRAQPGNGEYDKRLTTALRSIEMIANEEPVTGWPTLEQHVPSAVLDEVRELLGLPLPPRPDDALTARVRDIANAKRKPDATGDEIRAEWKVARNKIPTRSTNTAAQLERDLLTRLLSGDIFVEDEAFSQAAIIAVRHAPRHASHASLCRELRSSAGRLAPNLDEIVKSATDVVARDREDDERSDDDDEITHETLPANQVLEPEDIAARLRVNDKGDPESCGSNIALVLRHSIETCTQIRFNELTKTVEITGGPFKDCGPNDLPIAISNWLNSKWSLGKVKSHDVGPQLLFMARKNSYNPVAEYLDTLTWDRVPRLDTWLELYAHAQVVDKHGQDIAWYVRRVASMFLIAAVARGLSPGAKVDTVLVLEGLQGAKKSTCLKVLGGAWFTDSPINIGSKDGQMMAACQWIAELAELAAASKARVDEVRQFLSASTDDYRPPYGTAIEKFPRRCVFAGTVNPVGDQGYLRDEAGNRRFWPVWVGNDNGLEEVQQIQIAQLRRDRDQIWAEAVHRYKYADVHPELAISGECTGERWWFEPAEQRLVDRIVSQRDEVDVYHHMLEPVLEGLAGVVTMDDVWKVCGVAEKRPTPTEARRIDSVMRKMGWNRPGKDGRKRCGRAGKVACYVTSEGEQWLRLQSTAGSYVFIPSLVGKAN